MQVFKFRLKRHFQLIEKWMRHRGLTSPLIEETPETGFVVYDRCFPIALVSIRKVEGGFGMLDGLISNPLVSGELRHLAIDLLITETLNAAKRMKLKNLSAYSVDVNTIMRAKNHGFVQLPHAVLANALTKE